MTYEEMFKWVERHLTELYHGDNDEYVMNYLDRHNYVKTLTGKSLEECILKAVVKEQA